MTKSTYVALILALTLPGTALAGPVYHPPGANLTYGDVTHGMRVQSASSNPAAAASDRARHPDKSIRGTAVSLAAGIEYGNIQELFDFYDQLSQAFAPSEPGEGGGPGQNPDEKPDDGINIGDILDTVDPDVAAAVEALADEVAVQSAILALISVEGYARAWAAADIPFVMGSGFLDGTWTFGVNLSGSARAFGLVEEIDFDADDARVAIEDWVNALPIDRPPRIQVSDDIVLTPVPDQNAVLFQIENDSSLLTKSAQTGDISLGYSREGWTNASGALYWGLEGHMYVKRLSRLSVRYGDITDSKELFEAIRDNDYRTDEGFGLDIGVLWAADTYQLGAQVTNINEPSFVFPDVNLSPYSSEEIISFLEQDQRYVLERQLKLEASFFGSDRRWSVNLGLDGNAIEDALGDEFQWATLSAGFSFDSWWVPNFRFGYRQNLAGTELGYLSLGLTAFKFVNFDIASALDTVSIDGTDLPQGLMASIGFQIHW
jgi:hypothetical protein